MGKTDSYLVFALLSEGDKTEEDIFEKAKKIGFSIGESEKDNIKLELRYHKELGELEIKKGRYHLLSPKNMFGIKQGIRDYIIDMSSPDKCSQPVQKLITKLKEYI